jgi:hypothetical protein
MGVKNAYLSPISFTWPANADPNHHQIEEQQSYRIRSNCLNTGIRSHHVAQGLLGQQGVPFSGLPRLAPSKRVRLVADSLASRRKQREVY